MILVCMPCRPEIRIQDHLPKPVWSVPWSVILGDVLFATNRAVPPNSLLSLLVVWVLCEGMVKKLDPLKRLPHWLNGSMCCRLIFISCAPNMSNEWVVSVVMRCECWVWVASTGSPLMFWKPILTPCLLVSRLVPHGPLCSSLGWLLLACLGGRGLPCGLIFVSSTVGASAGGYPIGRGLIGGCVRSYSRVIVGIRYPLSMHSST